MALLTHLSVPWLYCRLARITSLGWLVVGMWRRLERTNLQAETVLIDAVASLLLGV